MWTSKCILLRHPFSFLSGYYFVCYDLFKWNIEDNSFFILFMHVFHEVKFIFNREKCNLYAIKSAILIHWMWCWNVLTHLKESWGVRTSHIARCSWGSCSVGALKKGVLLAHDWGIGSPNFRAENFSLGPEQIQGVCVIVPLVCLDSCQQVTLKKGMFTFPWLERAGCEGQVARMNKKNRRLLGNTVWIRQASGEECCFPEESGRVYQFAKTSLEEIKAAAVDYVCGLRIAALIFYITRLFGTSNSFHFTKWK